MKPSKKRRGLSAGTVLMLVLTLAVAAGFAAVIPKLRGGTDVRVDPGRVLDALHVSGVPEPSAAAIPIRAEPVQTAATPPAEAAPAAAAVTASPAPASAAAVPAAPDTLTLTFGGTVQADTSIHKSVYYSAAKAYDFSEIFPLLAGNVRADHVIVSLDNIVDDSLKASDTVTVSDALSMLTQLKAGAAAVAWPGCMDKGKASFEATCAALRKRGLTPLGTAEDGAAAILELPFGSGKIAVLHYTSELSKAGRNRVRKDGAAGLVAVADAETVAADIARARAGGAEAVIVSVHWGQNGKTKPNKAQQQLARAIADAGADVIVGTGTNAVQPAVWLDTAGGRTLCCYSLGALLTSGRSNAAVAGMLLHLTFRREKGAVVLAEASYTPTFIWRYQLDGRYWYRVLASNGLAPDGMGDDQIRAMTRALKTVQDTVGSEALTLKTK